MSETKVKKTYTKQDFTSDQAVRWCPGCGDYAILAQTQKVFPDLGVDKENLVFISGIGCSSRFPSVSYTHLTLPTICKSRFISLGCNWRWRWTFNRWQSHNSPFTPKSRY